MVLVIALTNHQHDVGHAIAATVYPDFVARCFQLVNLSVGQPIGIEAKSQTIDGDIQICFVLLVQFVLHLSDGVAGEEPTYGHLVVPCLRNGTIQTPARNQSYQQFGNSINRLMQFGQQDHPLTHPFEDGSQDSPKDMSCHQRQNPTHTRLDDVPREIAREEFLGLLTCGLHCQH